jgi:hypothetical protein
VAEILAAWFPGVSSDVRYRVTSDRAITHALEQSSALVVVGTPKSHRLLRAVHEQLPLDVDGDAIVLAKPGGKHRFTGKSIGAMFVHPNPRAPERYLVVVTGTTLAGLYHATALARLLPDFLVYDERVTAAAGEQVLGEAKLLAGGFFENDWSVPGHVEDLDRPPAPPR